MLITAVDNDVLIKGIWYGLLDRITSVIAEHPSQCGILGSAMFIAGAVFRAAARADLAMVALELADEFSVVEPTEVEVSWASELEFAAQRSGLNLDRGESLLCAIVGLRDIKSLATGDKRAVSALEAALTQTGQHALLAGRVICLEQIFLRLIENHSPTKVRFKVCSQRDVDRTLTICFACLSSEESPDSWVIALKSYVADLRRQAPTLLST